MSKKDRKIILIAQCLELPVKEPAESVKRKIFWKELIQNVEPDRKEV